MEYPLEGGFAMVPVSGFRDHSTKRSLNKMKEYLKRALPLNKRTAR